MKIVVMKKYVINLILLLFLHSCNIDSSPSAETNFDPTAKERSTPQPLNLKERNLMEKLTDSLKYHVEFRKYSISALRENKENVVYKILFSLGKDPAVKQGKECDDFIKLIENISKNVYLNAMDDSMAYEVDEIELYTATKVFLATRTPCNIPNYYTKQQLIDMTGYKMTKTLKGYVWEKVK